MQRGIWTTPFALLVVALGCDVGARSTSSTRGPALRAVWNYPTAEMMGVAPRQSIRVQFNRFLSPEASGGMGICVRPAAADTCLTTDAFTVEYDPVDRVVVWIPKEPLKEQNRYLVRVLVPKGDSDQNAIRAFDGAPLETETTFGFTTGDATAVAVEPNRPSVGFCSGHVLCALPSDACQQPAPVTLDSPAVILNVSCASTPGLCHQGKPGGAAISGLVVSFKDSDGGTPAAVRRLVEQSQTPASETATDPDPGAPRPPGNQVLGFNMPFIDPGKPGNSFLLYKIILGGENYETASFVRDLYDCKDLPDAATNCLAEAGVAVPANKAGTMGTPVPDVAESWVPDKEWKPPAPDEYQRLGSRIRGSSMPFSMDPTVPARASKQDAHTLSAWIAAGAHVETCP